MSQDHKPSLSPGRRLREAWSAEPIRVPGVFNALVGRMAERSASAPSTSPAAPCRLRRASRTSDC